MQGKFPKSSWLPAKRTNRTEPSMMMLDDHTSKSALRNKHQRRTTKQRENESEREQTSNKNNKQRERESKQATTKQHNTG